MIEKLEKHIIGENAPGTIPLMVAPTAEQQVDKINELVDTVNKLYEEAENNARIRANHENLIDTLVQENNIHEKQIDELQMKLEPEKCESHAENVLTMVDNQVTADLPNIDLGELAFLSKENTELKDEIDRLETELELTRKALKIAGDALRTVRRYTAINQFAPKSREAHIVAKKALAEIIALEQKE